MSEDKQITTPLIEFNKKDSSQWITVNDNVMGGISTGKASRDNDGHLIFKGSLSLENNGGFSSIRTIFENMNLSKYFGIRIMVKGDGRTYQFRIRDDKNIDGLAYQSEFKTICGQWHDIWLPFNSFTPSFRGFIPKNATPLNLENINQFGFLIADKEAGLFELSIKSISAYCK